MAPKMIPFSKKKVLANHKLALESPLVTDEDPWWESSLYQDESAEFAEIPNTLLYNPKKLTYCLKPSLREPI